MTQERQQKPPGTVQAMLRKPDHGESSYRGCAKLTDKATVITGGDSGIGRAVAIAYASGAGATMAGRVPSNSMSRSVAPAVSASLSPRGAMPIGYFPDAGRVDTTIGRPGSFPGEFNQAHGIAVDSKDNVYIAENRGKRVHKFKIVAQ